MTRVEVAEQEPPPSECWCCGRKADAGDLVHLGNHPEVAVCPRCAHSLSKWAGEIEDRGRTGPAVKARGLFRQARRAVVQHGWHRNRFIGGPLRRLGRYLP